MVLHLADHDPSGIHMTRDVEERLERYARRPIKVKRIALTMAQVRRHRPPPNSAKESDANIGKYVSEFGTSECWELDALAPNVITSLISAEIERMVDVQAWAKAVREEQRAKRRLSAWAREWE